jgi:hypothetical protein
MIRGLDLFREHFAEYRKSFVLIGGVACHEWLATQGRSFGSRRTWTWCSLWKRWTLRS